MCSIGVVTTARFPFFSRSNRQLPRIARLSDSVPPEVNTISSGVRAERRGEPLTRLVERRARLAPPAVDAGGIAELGAVERLHRGKDFRANGRRRGMVEVDRCGHP